MRVPIVTRVAAGVGLYVVAMAIFLQGYFYFWKVVPILATLAEGTGFRFPAIVELVLAPWPLLGWPMLLILPVLLGVGALPERVFLRVSIIAGITLVGTQILLSCFFIYMQVLSQTWWVVALEKVGSSG